MDISLYRSIASQYQDIRSIHSDITLDTISRLIEEQILNHKLAVDFFACFQHFSEFCAVQSRYSRLGAICRRVFIYGVKDIEPPSITGVEFVEIDANSSLARERFLLVNTSDFWTVLLAQEIELKDVKNNERRFDGGWFCDEQVVERASLLISQIQGNYYHPLPARNYAQQSSHIAEINRHLLGELEQVESKLYRRSLQLSTLHQFSSTLIQHQPLPCIVRDAVQVLSMIFAADEALMALNLQKENFMIISSTGSTNSNSKYLSNLGTGPTGKALEKGKAVVIYDVRESGNFEPLLPTAQNIIAAPIKGHNRVYGVITVASNKPNQWDREDMQTVLAIAHIMATIIEQKAQVSGDMVMQLRRGRHLEQIVAKLRKPISRLLSLQVKLNEEVQLLPTQRKLMVEVETLYSEVADIIGVPKPVSQSNDSKLPSPPKTPPVFGAKIRSAGERSGKMEPARFGADSPDDVPN